MKRYTDKDILKKSVLAAKGKLPFDKFFYNAKLVDVYSERVLENASIGVTDGIISSVCPTFKAEAAEMIDCGGMYIAPSFIDAHMHIESSKLTPFAYCQGAIPHGTGCIFYDPMQILNISGMDGVHAFEHMLEELPIESGLQLPTFAPSGSSSCCSSQILEQSLSRSGACSFGETDGAAVENEVILEKLSLVSKMGLVINGHCPSMAYDSVCAAAAAGLSDDHECVSFEELCERLRCGMSVMVRQGTIEPDCEPLIKGVVENGISTSSLMFCTDDKAPEDIRENGCIDNSVRIAVKNGLPPLKALAMATLNAARHFCIENIIGSCTPGRMANFILFDDLNDIRVKKVYFKGRLAAENGKLIEKKSFDRKKYPCFDSSVKLPWGLSADKLTLRLPENAVSFNAEVISMPEGILTVRSVHRLSVCNGRPVPDTVNDILPVAIIDRSGTSNDIGLGFIKGLGIKRGAVASSAAQEGCAIAVSGTNADDMLIAAKEVEKMGGGAVICIGGKVIARRDLSVGGILSPLDIDDEIEESRIFSEALRLTGSNNSGLMTVLTVAPCSTIPEIGLTKKGLVDVGTGRIIPPIKEVFYE